jgi:hypothetical protein
MLYRPVGKMGGRLLLLTAVAMTPLVTPATTKSNSPFVLISPLELRDWIAKGQQREQRGFNGCNSQTSSSNESQDTPQIKIIKPSGVKPVTAPIDIDLDFVAGPDAKIRPDTFKVCYLTGFFTMDITDKVERQAQVSVNGVHVVGAQLPHGHHHLLLLIQDDKGRHGEQDVSFDVR